MKLKRIFLNKPLLIGGVCLCLILVVLCCLFIALFAMDIARTASASDKIGCIVFFAFGAFGSIIAMLLCLPRWYVYLRLTDRGILLKSAFHSPQIMKFESFRYIYEASYFHRGIFPIGYQVDFIVLSQVKLSNRLLKNINCVKNTSETIILKRNPTNIDFLLKNLPMSQRSRLEKLL